VKTASELLHVADEPLDWLASHYYKLYAPISSSDKLVGFDPCQILSQIKANSDSFGRLWFLPSSALTKTGITEWVDRGLEVPCEFSMNFCTEPA
jgi:hypothetical protein